MIFLVVYGTVNGGKRGVISGRAYGWWNIWASRWNEMECDLLTMHVISRRIGH